MAIKNIVFDFGGVIVELDTQRPIDRFREIGVADAAELLDPYEQKGLFLEFEQGKVDLETFRQRLSAHAGKELTIDDIYYGWMGFMRDVPMYKLEYILALRARYKVYILSNTNPVIMRWAKSPVFNPTGLPLTAYCEKIYASYEIGLTKPDPAIFEYMLRDAGMDPAETLFVDDSRRNVEVGASLGMKTYLPGNEEDWREAIGGLLED
ncbi:HAD superfamily hydrolase (TIGR01509 family) [Parabacteroides sp. PF5-6]|nr:HAD superfamily hydrolase (TIGR01509 family) [Parabacteroides sp. PF5-6]